MDNFIHIRELIVSPGLVADWQENDWDILLQQAYATNMLARLYWMLKEYGVENYIPSKMLWHFSSAHKVYLAHKLDVEQEIRRICDVLKFINITPIFLKGASYIIADDVCSKGRMFVDIDVFIEKRHIQAVEQIMKWQGWQGNDLSIHDEKYYRKWMHEIPPLSNFKSGMTLDIHHSLMPLTSRIAFNVEQLTAGANEQLSSGQLVLSKEDRVLHSALHLFLDGEFDKGFRDLCDMHLMLSEFSGVDALFWEKLIVRSQELGITKVLYYCLKQTGNIFETKIPKDIQKKVNQLKGHTIVSSLMNWCFSKVLLPNHETCHGNYRYIATKILYIRGHWLKMPLHILIPHLLYKTFITPFQDWNNARKQPFNLDG